MNKTKNLVIEARFEDGMSYRDISNTFGIPKSTVYDWCKEYEANGEDSGLVVPRGFTTTETAQKNQDRKTKSVEQIFEFFEELAPINVMNKISTPSVKDSVEDVAIVIGDMHFPLHCQKTIDIFYETVRQLRPKTIVLNGDTVDMLATSRFPKDVRKIHKLSDERVEYHKFLDNLLKVSGKAKILETNANHSGNSNEGRWWRFLSERIGELADLPDVLERLSYENVFLGPYQKHVSLVDHVELTDDFIVLHGDVVRKNGGYSARGMLEKLQVSLMHNHTHRFGFTAQRIPAIGKRKDKQIYAWENAAACDLNPCYTSFPNWQNGFSIVGLDGQNFSVEQVMVNNGVANVATLGCTIKA